MLKEIWKSRIVQRFYGESAALDYVAGVAINHNIENIRMDAVCELTYFTMDGKYKALSEPRLHSVELKRIGDKTYRVTITFTAEIQKNAKSL